MNEPGQPLLDRVLAAIPEDTDKALNSVEIHWRRGEGALSTTRQALVELQNRGLVEKMVGIRPTDVRWRRPPP